MTTFLIIIIALLLAILIGGWRQQCRILEDKMPSELPRLWYQSKTVPVISWLAVSALSVIAAIGIIYLAIPVNWKYTSYFTFGAILSLRWAASALTAPLLFLKKYPNLLK